MACDTWIIDKGKLLAHEYEWDQWPLDPYILTFRNAQTYCRSKTERSYWETSTCGTWRGWRCRLHISINEALKRLPHFCSLELFFNVPRTDMFRTMWVFLIRERDEEQETVCYPGYSGCVLPEMTHPKHISSAERVPVGLSTCRVGLYRWKHLHPEERQSSQEHRNRSARRSPVRCFQRQSKGTRNAGKGAVILGCTSASIPYSSWGVGGWTTVLTLLTYSGWGVCDQWRQ